MSLRHMFTIRSTSLLAVLALASSCTTYNVTSSATNYSMDSKPVVVIDDHAFRSRVGKTVDELMKKTTDHTPHAELVKQLSRTSCALDLPQEGFMSLTPSQIYQRALKSTVAVGPVYHCKSTKCTKNHVNLASGVIIHPSGIVLTNYHVVDTAQTKVMAMAVSTQAGDVYLVDEVLASSKKDDVAILKLRGAADLPAIPIHPDEAVGNPVTVVSHPDGQFYTLTQGYVSRYASRRGHRVMNITADYAKGSSGGPVFNSRGDLVGLVASTNSIAYTNIPLSVDEDDNSLELKKSGGKVASVQGKPLVMQTNHQMTVKNCVPSYAIMKLFKAPTP